MKFYFETQIFKSNYFDITNSLEKKLRTFLLGPFNRHPLSVHLDQNILLLYDIIQIILSQSISNQKLTETFHTKDFFLLLSSHTRTNQSTLAIYTYQLTYFIKHSMNQKIR